MSRRNYICVKMFLMDDYFGYWLQREREKRGLTQARLAKLANLNRAVINKIENNQSAPNKDTLQRIADALNLPDEVVFRAAGYLRSPADTEYFREAIHYLQQLSFEDQQEILELLRFKVGRKAEKEKEQSRTKKERTAQIVLNS